MSQHTHVQTVNMLFSQGGQSSLGAGRTLQLGSQRDSDERTGLLMGPGIAGPSSQVRDDPVRVRDQTLRNRRAQFGPPRSPQVCIAV